MMYERKNFHSASSFEQQIGFSRAVRVGHMLFISGTAPIAEDGQTHGLGDLYEQTCRCFEISKSAIEAAGAKLDHVVRTKIYLTNVDNWHEAARAHHLYFSDIMPACTIVEVSRFINKEWLVETEIDCYISESP